MTLLRTCLLAVLLGWLPAVRVAAQPSARGDANADGAVTIADAGFLSAYLLGEGQAPVRSCLADVNADASTSPADAFRLIDFIVAGGTPPPPQPAEVCNGADDDCDGVPDDGVQTTYYADADGDTYGTSAVVLQACSPPPGYVARAGDCDDSDSSINPAAIEQCNSLDDNCDGTIDEGFNLSSDPSNCGSCGNVCVALNSTNPCTAGVCTPACLFGWASCDSNPNNGCETLLNTNPTCTSTLIGAVSGDGAGASVTRTGRGEEFVTVRVNEGSGGIFVEDLTARVTLVVPPGVDYDLIVRCNSCPGASQTSQTETVSVRNIDDLDSDDSFDLIIEIRFSGATGATAACASWSLTVQGDTTPVAGELLCSP